MPAVFEGKEEYETYELLVEAMKAYSSRNNMLFLTKRYGPTTAQPFNKKNVQFSCQRAGKPRVNTGNQPRMVTPGLPEKNTASMKCGCTFLVWAQETDSGSYGIREFKSEHTNGCVPSIEQMALGKRKRGGNVFLDDLSYNQKAAFSTLLSTQAASGSWQSLAAEMGLSNVLFTKHQMRDMKRSAKKWTSTEHAEDRPVIHAVNNVSTERKKIAKDWLRVEELQGPSYKNPDAVAKGDAMVGYLKDVAACTPGFVYRVAHDHDKTATAYMFGTKEGIEDLNRYGIVTYLDPAVSRTREGFVGCALLVQSEERSILPTFFLLCRREDMAAMEWFLSLVRMLSRWDDIPNRAVLMDSKLGVDMVGEVVPGAVTLLCTWHMERDVRKYFKPRYADAADFVVKELILAKSDDSFKLSWGVFEERCRDDADDWGSMRIDTYMKKTWMGTYKHWSRPAYCQYFTLGNRTSSPAESENARALALTPDSSRKCKIIEIFERQLDLMERLAARAAASRATAHVLGSLNNYMFHDKWSPRTSYESFSEHATVVFWRKVQEADEHYKAEVEMEEGGVQVWRISKPDKPRRLARDPQTGLLVCSCLTPVSEGIPCCHIIVGEIALRGGKDHTPRILSSHTCTHTGGAELQEQTWGRGGVKLEGGVEGGVGEGGRTRRSCAITHRW